MSISVSTLIRYLKNKLDSDDKLRKVKVTGELSNFHRHYSGHLYFTLKDDKSQISCVMFSSYANTLQFEPKNGDKVDIDANVSIFETSGQLQLYVNSMKLSGIGDLYQQFEELKNKLSIQGYFNEEHKTNLKVKYITKVAVLVGDKSAAMSDIKTCFQRRWPLVTVDYYPVLVQGNDAPLDIISTLKEVDSLNYDAIILARGGGSFEDLFCFNNEELVKTIYNLKTFIVTGIGHEQDFTLSDFVSDLRAPTPTATVELITPNIFDIINDINKAKDSITLSITRLLNRKKMEIDYYTNSISSFSLRINSISQNIKHSIEKIQLSLLKNLNAYKIELNNYNPLKFKNLLYNNLNNKKLQLKSIEKILSAYSIDNTLKRGYSLVYKDNVLIKNSSLLKSNDDIKIRLYGGDVKATVKE